MPRDLGGHRRWAQAVAALGLAGLLSACTREAPPAASAAPPEVGVLTVQAERLPVLTELSGRTTPRLVAEVRPQVGGIVQRRLFEEGALVKAGQLLYELDPATLQATHASARAAVRKAQSTVNANNTVARRNRELRKIDAISQQDEDSSEASLQQSIAELEVARAAEAAARIQLGYARITAPIAGRIGLSNVTPGALVTTNQTASMTTIQQFDPIHVDVTQSSTELLRLRRDMAEGRLRADGDDAAAIEVLLDDGSVYPHKGRLTFSGVTVDAGTGSVTLRAVVPNPEGLLLPGMFVRARLSAGVDLQALLVPQRALIRNADGSATVMVIDTDDKVARRRVSVGRAVGDRWQVLDGLAAGDRVLVDGAQKVRTGDAVRPVPIDAIARGGSLDGASAATAAPAMLGTAPALR